MSEKYFLGGMSPNGFKTQLSDLVGGTDCFTYILKGGAGTGKSSLMKKIADRFEKSEKVTRYYCSSDPDSLDAVVLHSSKRMIVDGTAPHVFDPVYPGVCQKIVDLGRFWDQNKLKSNSGRIINTIDTNKSLMSAASCYGIALGKICSDTFNCAGSHINLPELESFAKTFCEKLLNSHNDKKGRKRIRHLSAMTRFGYMTQIETISDYDTVYVLDDSFFAAADRFAELITEYAINSGYDITLSPCLLFGNQMFQHLLIEDAGIAIITCDPLTRIEYDNAQKINMSQFYNTDDIRKYDDRLKGNAALIETLSDAQKDMLNSAKLVHDEIESYYINAMDFEAINRAAEDIFAEIEA